MTIERARVLCVDDEPHVLRALTWLLGGQFEVSTATDAVEALGLLQKNDYDVVISDQRMPGVSGVEFLRDVRKRAPRAMRILLSGYSDLDAMVGSANESQVFRFVAKPWNVQELSHLVAEAAAIARSAPVEERSPVEDAPAGAQETVLLVDDSAESGERVRRELRGAVQLRHATDLAQALAILDKEDIAVMVCDVKLRGIDAGALVRVAKQRHPSTVTVVSSETRDAEQVMSLINEGQVFRFVHKPVHPGTLGPVIDAALRRHRRLRCTPGLAQRYSAAPAPEAAAALARSLAAAKAQSLTIADAADGARKGALSAVLRWLRGR